MLQIGKVVSIADVITVRGVDSHFITLKLKRRNGILGSPLRCVVVDSIPKEYKELLDTVEVQQ
jgi:hypothetical protein